MKVFRLVTGPELSQTVSATDFLYKNKYVNPNSMVQKVLEKYPMQPAMPKKHPDPMTDPQMDRNFKFVSEMNAGDRELLWRSYMHAMSKNIDKRIKWRREAETKLQRIADHQLHDLQKSHMSNV